MDRSVSRGPRSEPYCTGEEQFEEYGRLLEGGGRASACRPQLLQQRRLKDPRHPMSRGKKRDTAKNILLDAWGIAGLLRNHRGAGVEPSPELRKQPMEIAINTRGVPLGC